MVKKIIFLNKLQGRVNAVLNKKKEKLVVTGKKIFLVSVTLIE